MFVEDGFEPRCHEVEHRRKVGVKLVNCLSEASFFERRIFREAQRSEGPSDRAPFLLVRLLRASKVLFSRRTPQNEQ
jgi:hypothetical protein